MNIRKVKRRIIYKIIIILFLIFGIIVLRRSKEIDKLSKILIMERSIRTPMNQGECRHPHLPIDNPEIMKFYEPNKKIDCGNSLGDWVKCDKSMCFVKPEILSKHGDVVCSYTDLIRKNDYKLKYGKTTKTKEPYLLHESDFAKVACISESGSSWSGMVYGVRDILKTRQNLRDNEKYNVVMFGFDSLSRNAFMRKLSKSYDYLTQQLGAIVLKGYNVVGDGTPQALIPLLTGFTELELPETRKRFSNSLEVDVYPMIWKEYSSNGYITSFNEDTPNIGTFTYRMKGFQFQPVDHYLRTFYVEVQNSFYQRKDFCIGHQPEHLVMLDYTKKVMEKYFETPHFVFSFHGALSHDSINLIGAADDDILLWLKNSKEKLLLENTILIFMADHGNRFSDVRATLQGKQEERLPFFSFTFPDSFKKRFPSQYNIFVNNSNRLTTPFDVHATLIDILRMSSSLKNIPSNKQVPMENKSFSNDILLSPLASQRAISLFERIPKNRSCADAYIEPHWCACLKWKELQISNTSHISVLLKVANSIINTINNATQHYRNLCSKLELLKINWALKLLPHNELLKYKRNSDIDGFLADMSDNMLLYEEVFQLQIIANPGHSIFEASVVYNLRTFNADTKLTQISRVNKYGNQASCIYERDPEIRKYCYCRT